MIMNEKMSSDQSSAGDRRVLNRLRLILPLVPLFALLLPILLFWLPELALYVLVILIYALYPYASTWSPHLSQLGMPSQLAYGILISAIHWTFVGFLHAILSRRLADRQSIGLWILLAFLSVVSAYSMLDYLGYEVKVQINF